MSRTGAVKSKRGKKFAQGKLKKEIEKRRQFQKQQRLREKKKNRLAPARLSTEEQNEVRLQQALATSMNKRINQKGKKKEEEEEEEEDFTTTQMEEEEMSEEEMSSEEEESDDEDEVTATDADKMKKAISRHQKDLEELKKQDPEFYKYLAENDDRLLNFDYLPDNDEEEEEEEEEDEEEEEEEEEEEDEEEEAVVREVKGKKKEKAEEMEEDMVMDDGEDRKELTTKILSSWYNQMFSVEKKKKGVEGKKLWKTDKGAMTCLKKMLVEFRYCCHVADEDQKFLSPHKISKSSVFNEVLVFCFKNLPSFFSHLLSYTPPSAQEEDQQKIALPDRNIKKWRTYAGLVKMFLRSGYHFLANLPSDESMLCFVLKNLEQSVVFFATQDKLCSKFFKTTLGIWSKSDHQGTKILSFFLLRKLAIVTPYPFINTIIKKTSRAFIRECKFVSPSNLHLITFMSNCLLEILRLDFLCSYQFMFVHLRECAVQLRTTMGSKTKENLAAVFSWQRVLPLQMWTDMIINHPDQPEMKEMIYPLTQIIMGIYGLIDSPKYYPLKLRCLEMLSLLVKHTGVFIPIGGHIISIFEQVNSKHNTRGGKFKSQTGPAEAKKFDFRYTLKMSKSLVETKGYLDAVVLKLSDILVSYFSSFSYSIAYPDLCAISIIRLRKVVKECREINWNRRMKIVIDKMEQNLKFISGKRQSVNFQPTDIEDCINFANQFQNKKEKSPLVGYMEQREKTMRSITGGVMEEEEEEEDMGEGEVFAGLQERKVKKAKKVEKKEKKVVKKKKKVVEELADDEGMEDVVEDFELSSDEED